MPFTHRDSVTWLIHLFVGVAELLLLLRVVLRFFNSNSDAAFVNWVYTATAPLLEPLRGIFTSAGTISEGWVVDYPALLAMVLYAVVGYMLVGLLGHRLWKR